MTKPFGYSYFLDMYNTKIGTADDLDLIYRFLEKLVDEIKMTRMTPPIVVHGPTDNNGKELYPDKAGVSGWVGLIESGIQIHAIEPKRFISLDVYSCSQFEPTTILNFAKKYFEFEQYEDHYIPRGMKYHS